METKFNFNSQVCSSLEQSRRLLALGLKKETADMSIGHTGLLYPYPHREEEDRVFIPSWSLHRLLCLYNCHYLEFMGEKEIAGAYDIVIDAIAQAIEGGYFNEKYLV